MNLRSHRQNILISVKTYPTPSSKYGELVCTAGFREDGSWVRIYPVPFRSLASYKRYEKYRWIKLSLVRNASDPRPETFRPVDLDDLQLGEKVGTENGTWTTRKKIALKTIYTNRDKLVAKAKDPKVATSLAVFKPKRVTGFEWVETERDWDQAKLERNCQLDLFKPESRNFESIPKLPYKFSYIFEDDEGHKSKLMIEDWETGQLFWNCLRQCNGNEKKACMKVREKYLDTFADKHDLYFFWGTTRVRHFTAKNPFIIIGTFHPKLEHQTRLEL